MLGLLTESIMPPTPNRNMTMTRFANTEPRSNAIAQCQLSLLSKSQLTQQHSVGYGGLVSPNSVVIGRGNICKTFPGNLKLEAQAQKLVSHYAGAVEREDKSEVVSYLINLVQKAGGTFVKYKDGRYTQVNMRQAREKVGTILRNLLADKYRSSCKSKVRKRQASRRQKQSRSSSVSSQSSTCSKSVDSVERECCQEGLDQPGTLDHLLSCKIILQLPGDDGDMLPIPRPDSLSTNDSFEKLDPSS